MRARTLIGNDNLIMIRTKKGSFFELVTKFSHRDGFAKYRIVIPEREPSRTRRLKRIRRIIRENGGKPVRKQAVEALLRVGCMYQPLWFRKEDFNAYFNR